MPTHRFSLTISATQFQEYYRGTATSVVTRSNDGQRLALPISALQPFVTREGVHGHFEIECTAQHKLIQIRRVSQ